MTLSARKGTRDAGGQALPGMGGFTPPLRNWGRKGGKQRRVPARCAAGVEEKGLRPARGSAEQQLVGKGCPHGHTAASHREHVAQPRCRGRARVAHATA